MHLVEDKDLEPAVRGGKLYLIEHGVDVLDLVVRGGVELNHVHVTASGDAFAVVARTAGMDGGALLAVERHRKNTRQRGLADATRTDEEVRVGDSVLLDGVGKGARDVALPHDVVKRLGAPLSREHFVGHVSGSSVGPPRH